MAIGPRPFQFSITYHLVLQQPEIDSVSSSTIPPNELTYILEYTHTNTHNVELLHLKSSHILLVIYS